MTIKDRIEEQPSFQFRLMRVPGCWLWTGSKGGTGYPEMVIKGKRTQVRRFLLEKVYSITIPPRSHVVAGKLCLGGTTCVNPSHAKIPSLNIDLSLDPNSIPQRPR